MITVAAEANLILGFSASNDFSRNFSFATYKHHFFFFFFFVCVRARARATKENQVKNIIAILKCYKAFLGLKVNLFKSTLSGISADPYLVARLVEIMGCKVGSLPSSYQGLPLSIASVSTSLWNLVVERIERNLVTWRARYLSIRGRITLIQSTLFNLPIYFMLLFRCSPSEH